MSSKKAPVRDLPVLFRGVSSSYFRLIPKIGRNRPKLKSDYIEKNIFSEHSCPK